MSGECYSQEQLESQIQDLLARHPTPPSVAKRLTKAVRGRDVVGRLGGDEFLVVCHEVDGADDALAAAQRIAATLRPASDGDDQLRGASASVGVAWTRGDHDADLLMARADHAMYGAKRSSGDRPVLAPPAP